MIASVNEDLICPACGERRSGGFSTNGDGFGDAKHVGITPPAWATYCWDCVRQGKMPNLSAEINSAFAERGWCGFLKAWVGRCRNPKPCAVHASERCWKCNGLAVKNCERAGVLVCGAPECAAHPHVHKGDNLDGL